MATSSIPSKRRKTLNIVCIALCAVLVLSAVALVLVGNFFYNFALNPNSPYSFIPAPEVLGSDVGTSGQGDGQDDGQWLAASADTAALTSGDGLALSAYQMTRAGSHRYAVICHGYQSNAAQMGKTARRFYELGYNLLVPDARGHGLSRGDYIGMGWHERRDIVDWCKQLSAADPQAQIVLYGISMGGATVMMASGEADLPANVSAVVEDCGYSSAWDEFAGQLKALYRLPTFPILDVTNLITQFRAGYDFKEASAVEQVKKSVTPTLFIHGEADTFVPFSMLALVYDAAACEKEQLAVPGAGHAEAARVDPTAYWGAIEAFLEKHIS